MKNLGIFDQACINSYKKEKEKTHTFFLKITPDEPA